MKLRRQGWSRRDVLQLAPATLLGTALNQAACTDKDQATTNSAENRINRVRRFTVTSKRWKVVGKNSHLDVHGDTATDALLIIDTTGGQQGFGWSRSNEGDAAELLDRDPLDFFQPGRGIVSPLGRGDAPLWDLTGKILNEPAWRLLGGYGPEWVPVYDGSIYFSDLQPEYADRGIPRILEEIDHSLELGHRAFKIKVGRGFKWMAPEPGLVRDIEVVRAIRAHVGPDVKLMVDSNNGYDLATTKRFLKEADIEFFFVEEMFPESVEEDLELKGWIRSRDWNTLARAFHAIYRSRRLRRPARRHAPLRLHRTTRPRANGSTFGDRIGSTQLGVIPRALHAADTRTRHSELRYGRTRSRPHRALRCVRLRTS
jgi:hypothetical protein